MKTPDQIAFDLIAGVEAGLEQDIGELERHWPAAKRGSRADRLLQSILFRARSMIEIAKERAAAVKSE